MSYDTRYYLKEKNGNSNLIYQLVKENENAAYALDKNGNTRESCSWYEHEEDLIGFSLKHPEALFELSGEGEDNSDMWKKYFQNGKVQICRAKVIFDEFNPALLQ